MWAKTTTERSASIFMPNRPANLKEENVNLTNAQDASIRPHKKWRGNLLIDMRTVKKRSF